MTMNARDVSQDNPATLRRTSDGAEVRVSDPSEYQTLTTTAGYKDITGEGSGKKKSSSSSSSSSSSASSSGSSGPSAA